MFLDSCIQDAYILACQAAYVPEGSCRAWLAGAIRVDCLCVQNQYPRIPACGRFEMFVPREECTKQLTKLCKTLQGKTSRTKLHHALRQMSQKIRSLGVAHNQAYTSSTVFLCSEDNRRPVLTYHHHSSSHAPWQTHRISLNPCLADNGPFWPLLVYRSSERLPASPCFRSTRTQLVSRVY